MNPFSDRDSLISPNNTSVTLRGRVQHITFQNPDTHFTIARLLTDPE